ncbi:acyltransferase family protein [Vibrio vulnificus]
MFIQSIHNFRAIAILMVVMVHVYAYGLENTPFYTSVFKNILSGCTALLVFISGYMFHHVFYKSFSYSKFIRSKFSKVVTPYLFLSTMAIFMLYAMKGGYFSSTADYGNIAFFNAGDSDPVTILKYYLTGRMITAYWYIPCAILLFLCSPLHVKFIHAARNQQIITIALLSILSIVVHRSYENINPIQMFIYFTPIYLLGIYVSLHGNPQEDRSKTKAFIFTLLALLIAVYQSYTGHQGNYTKEIFEFNGIDFMFIQKFFLCLSVYYLTNIYVFNNKIMNTIANTSFAIFFIHPWVITTLKRLPFYGEQSSYNPIYYFITFALVITISTCSAVMLKKLLKPRIKTKYIIGY